MLSAQALATSLVGNGYSAAQLSGNAVNAACSGKVSYEDAMRPHLAFIKKNVDNVGLYYRVACNVVERFGKKRIKERAVKILE